MRFKDLFFEFDEDEDEPVRFEPGEMERCTPERLLAFINEVKAATGKPPTLRDCRQRFGGILGPIVDSWELRRRGLI